MFKVLIDKKDMGSVKEIAGKKLQEQPYLSVSFMPLLLGDFYKDLEGIKPNEVLDIVMKGVSPEDISDMCQATIGHRTIDPLIADIK